MRYSSLNASDRKLITEIAEYWITNGGDAEGFTWCAEAIKERIAELKDEKDSQTDLANVADEGRR